MRKQVQPMLGLLGAVFVGLGFSAPAQAIVGGTATTAYGQVSNGVQITSNWVVTARHLGFGAGDTYSNGYGSSVVAASYNLGSGDFPFDDLTLVRLATPIIAPQLSLLANELEAGVDYTIDATMTTGRNQVPRGYAYTTVRSFIPSYDPDGSDPLPAVRTNWLQAYSNDMGVPYLQGGDSGGGLFFGHHDSITPDSLLWGINSAVSQDPDGHGGTLYSSLFVQLGSYRSWIDLTMANDVTDAQSAQWITLSSVPEPGSATMLLAGLGLMAFGAKRLRRA